MRAISSCFVRFFSQKSGAGGARRKGPLLSLSRLDDADAGRLLDACEGEAYARRLKEAGVEVTAVRYNGTIHDFVLLNALRNVPSTEAALKQINEGISKHLNAAMF